MGRTASRCTGTSPLVFDKVLRRENPGEIPIYESVSFKLAINLKTAKALGLGSAVMVARADEVIE